MFGSMRRSGQELRKDECREMLRSCSTGVLGLVGPDGYPYTVPLNFVFDDEKVLFHCAHEGHKIDCIRHDNRVSFCVVQQDKIVPQAFATDYRSTIVFGKARIVTDDLSRRRALERLNEKYAPLFPEEGREEIKRCWSKVSIVEIEIEHMTGKEAIRSVRQQGST